MLYNNLKNITVVMMTGFRDFDCGDSLSPWMCNILAIFPQDVMFEMYTCLSNTSTVIDPDNLIENKIYYNYYPLFEYNDSLKPLT